MIGGFDLGAIASGGLPYLLFSALVGLVVWLFRRTIDGERQRAEDWRHLYDTEHETVNVLLNGVRATTVVAETSNKVLEAVPVPIEKG